MQIPELLAPAGNWERLETALRFGADAVYLGLKEMSLRNFANNFTLQELDAGCGLAHGLGRRVYVTVNAFARDGQFERLMPLMRGAREAGADALIVNDPGVIALARDVVPGMPLHLSTQANTLNSRAARFWQQSGITRIVLARELTLREVADIQAAVPELELEMFVHGAMCVSYSGRCLLSNYIAGRDAYRGECAQPCRWTYEIRETGTDGEYFPIEQDELGTYLLNARDMNLIGHLSEVISTGVHSLKIEGRMKSIYYVAGVVNAYRMALDAYQEAKAAGRTYQLPAGIEKELNHISHRPYWTGFAFGDPGREGQETKSAQYIQDGVLLARVLSYDAKTKRALLEQRNRFSDGEQIGILAPGDIGRSAQVSGMWDADTGEAIAACPHPKQLIFVGCEEPVREGDLIRRMPDASKGT